jgi:hypothetical protein
MSHRIVAIAAAAALAGSLLALTSSASPAEAATQCSTTISTSSQNFGGVQNKTTKTTKVCQTTKSKSSVWVIAWRDSVANGTNRAASFKCKTNKETKETWSVTGNLEGAFKAKVWAVIKANVGGSLQQSVATGYGTQTTISVPAKKTTYCERGFDRWTNTGTQTTTVTTVKTSKSGSGPWKTFSPQVSTSTKSWTAKAPTYAYWKLYDK